MTDYLSLVGEYSFILKVVPRVVTDYQSLGPD